MHFNEFEYHFACSHKLLPCYVYAGSSMEFQCFEIQIKTEADRNECPHDDKPSSGMFAVSDDTFSALGSSRGSVIVMDCQLGNFHCHPC